MAVINYSLHNFGGSHNNHMTIVKWAGLEFGDTGQPFDLGDEIAYSVSYELVGGSGVGLTMKVANNDMSPSPGSSNTSLPTIGQQASNLNNFRGRWYWPETEGEAGGELNVFLLVGKKSAAAI